MNANSKSFTRCMYSLLGLALLATGAVRAQTVEVTSADPSSAVQGTLSLDVTVNGNGFDSTAQVKFLVTGTVDPGGITVKKVSVRGSKKLIATIDVGDTAAVANFDIEVTLSGGRKGIGTTKFTVLAKPNSDPCTFGAMTYEGNWEGFPAFAYVYRRTPLDSTREIRLASRNGLCSKQVGELQAGVSSLAFVRVGGPYVLAWVADNWNVRLMWFETGGLQETASHVPAQSTLFRDRAHYVDLSPDGTSLAYQWDTPVTGAESQIRIASLNDPDSTGANDTVVYQSPYFPKVTRDVWWAPWGRVYLQDMDKDDVMDILSVDPSGGLDPAPALLLHFVPPSTPIVGQIRSLGRAVDGGHVGTRSVIAFNASYISSVKRNGTWTSCSAIYLIDAETGDFVLGRTDVPSPLKAYDPSMSAAGSVLAEAASATSSCDRSQTISESDLGNLQSPVSISLTGGYGPAALKVAPVP